MRVIGIDPGSGVTGYGVIEIDGDNYKHIVSGCIRPPATFTLGEKAYMIYDLLGKVLDEYSPHSASIEKVFVYRSASSTITLAHARGAAMVALSKRKIGIKECSTSTVKKFITGNGSASKQDVQQKVCSMLALSANDTPSLDASDALAIAIYGAGVMKHDDKV